MGPPPLLRTYPGDPPQDKGDEVELRGSRPYYRGW
jgi:hypothetical protein